MVYKHQALISYNFDGWKIMTPADSVSDESPFPHSQMVLSHCVLRKEGTSKFARVSFLIALIYLM